MITGSAAGVPFVALPPAGDAGAPASVVVAWHLLDPPRSEAALAASLPLAGLDAWRIYLGLPLCGARLPAGGWEDVMRLAYEDVVLSLYAPVVYGAAAELTPALAELRLQLGLARAPIAVMGGSIGAAVAQLVMAEGDVEIAAAVLVSPVVRVRGAIEAGERRFGGAYAWSDASEAVADRLDFVARAADLAGPAVLLVVGEDDDVGFRQPAAELAAALDQAGARAEVVVVPGMAHALADEPGTDPAPQTPHAAAVDRLAVAWFRRHLVDAAATSSRGA